jgi:hypothetical protein
MAVVFLWAVLTIAGLVGAAEKGGDEEKVKDPAELLAGAKDKTSISGIFRLQQQTLRDGKPLPKLIGTITGQGPVYQVVVRDNTVMSRLAMENGKKVIVSGSFLNAGEQGVFILADSLVDSEAAPVERRKRGGL